MQVLVAILIGGCFACAFYLLLRRSLQRVLFGLVLLGHGANLLVFTAAGLVRDGVPIIAGDAEQLTAPYPDPLPQALILTAVVINFGITAFALVLAHRAHVLTGFDTLQEEDEASDE